MKTLSYRSQEEELKLNKIAALYSNEMIKIFHRVSVWIVMVIMLAIAILAPIAFKGSVGDYNDQYDDYVSYLSKEEFTRRRDSLAQILKDTNDFVKHSNVQYTTQNETHEVFSTWLDCDEDKATDYSSYICYNNLISTYNFESNRFNTSWLTINALQSYVLVHHDICYLNLTPFSERDEEWYKMYTLYSQAFDLYSEALFSNNLNAYYSGEVLMDTVGRSRIEISSLQRLMEIDPDASFPLDKANCFLDLLNEIDKCEQDLHSNLARNKSTLPRVLTQTEKSRLRDRLSILNYHFDHGNYFTEEVTIAHQINNLAITFGRFALIVLLVLIAGTSVSQELATGSIKSLIIAPVRRWKIFLAKLLSIISWCIVGSILLVGASTLTTMFLYRNISLPEYIYVSGGMIHRIPYLIYMIMSFFVSSLSLFVYLILAFMISCISKNTGVSVAVSSALILCSNLPSILIELGGRKRWIDFLPSINMDIKNLVFPFSNLMNGLNNNDFFITENTINNSLSFSLIYVAVLLLIMLTIAYDAFTKRDIQ